MILNTSIIPIIVVLAIIIRQRKYIQKFLTTGTISPQTAQTLDFLELSSSSLIFKGLLRRKIILNSVENKYWLNEENLKSYKKLRIKIILSIVVTTLIVLFFANIYLS